MFLGAGSSAPKVTLSPLFPSFANFFQHVLGLSGRLGVVGVCAHPLPKSSGVAEFLKQLVALDIPPGVHRLTAVSAHFPNAVRILPHLLVRLSPPSSNSLPATVSLPGVLPVARLLVSATRQSSGRLPSPPFSNSLPKRKSTSSADTPFFFFPNRREGSYAFFFFPFMDLFCEDQCSLLPLPEDSARGQAPPSQGMLLHSTDRPQEAPSVGPRPRFTARPSFACVIILPPQDSFSGGSFPIIRSCLFVLLLPSPVRPYRFA